MHVNFEERDLILNNLGIDKGMYNEGEKQKPGK
jgi:hypothetical protein